MPKVIHNTRKDILQSPTSPVGDLVPSFIGQQCITSNNEIFFAKGLSNKDWIPASNVSEIQDKITVVEGEVDNLKSSVVNGKAVVAGAISDKGVSTPANADFIVMANNIRAIASGIEIKHATSLPSNADEGEFIILSNTSPSKIYIKHYEGENTSLNNASSYNNSDILVLFDKVKNSVTTEFDFTSGITRTKFDVMKVLQVIDGKYVQVDVYTRSNSQWVQVVNKEFVVYNRGTYMQQLLTGTISVSDYTGSNGTNNFKDIYSNHTLAVIEDPDALRVVSNRNDSTNYGYMRMTFYSSKIIDFSIYRTLEIEGNVTNVYNSLDSYIRIGVADQANNNTLPISISKQNDKVGEFKEILDISSFATSGYLAIQMYLASRSGYTSQMTMNIYKMTLRT